MTTEQLLIKALLTTEGCNAICTHGCSLNGYPDCDLDWCENRSKFELDIDKLKKEYDIKD